MTKSRVVSLVSSIALAIAASASAQQKVPVVVDSSTRINEAAGGGVQDVSWYPFEVKPPFVGALVEAEDAKDVIYAGNATFTINDPPAIPRDLEKPLLDKQGRFAPGYFVVHFADHVRPQDKDELDLLTRPTLRRDGTPVARWYIPNNALIAWVDDEESFRAIERMDNVDGIGRFQPAYKLDPTIGTALLTSPHRVGRFSYTLNVDVMPGYSLDALVFQLQTIGLRVIDVIEIRGLSTYDVRFVAVEALPGQVIEVARMEGVRMIQESGDGLLRHDLSSSGKLQARNLAVDDQASSPIVNATNFPIWLTHNLRGQTQLVGVVDTALDWNNVGTTGCGFGFPDTAISNWGYSLPNLSRVLLTSVGTGGVNLKIPRADLLGGAQLQAATNDDHGTGAAGSAVADFYGDNDAKWWEHDVDNWETWAPSNFSGLIGEGIAHEAQLFFTPVDDSTGAFRWEFIGEFEANMGTTLTNMANAGVSATNHSVGLAESANTYTQTSVTHDTKAFDHKFMLQCMAAGNSGAGTGKLTSQAVVKNVMTVGASDDVLRPNDRVSFSSTGPTFDNRRKPDVMAPGDDTFPRDQGVPSDLMLPSSGGSGATSCVYQFTAGTSFSSPTMTGATALVHQYFQEGRYPGTPAITDPSAALMKAVLINGGFRLTGANLGDNLYPNNYQGWGEPVLIDCLDLPGTARRMVARDVTSAAGFTSSASANHVVTFDVVSTGQKLKVHLVWTDEPGSTGTAKKLINDLDLRVTSPSATTYLGNVFNGTTGESITGGAADTVNNVEGFILSNPAVGSWTVTIDPGAGNYSGGQGYGLSITGDVSEGGAPGAPVANFTGSPTSGSVPLAVAFTDTSSGSVTSWDWTFGDGGTSTLQNPAHSYTLTGTYTVTLTATGPGGSDGETKTNYITVTDPPTGGAQYYLSFATATTVPGLGTVDDEDVVIFDAGTGVWSWYFDGSDVGLTADLDAIHLLADGDIVISVDADSTSIAGLTGGPNGTLVDDSDLVIFNVTTSGSTTSGTFSFIFDGSDVGLTTANEDVDAVYEFPGGGLGISILGSGAVTGVSSVQDEDVLFFAATAYGSTTTGTWSMQFDGSDVGFSTTTGEDIDAVSFDNGVDMLFSTLDTYSAAGGAGESEDVSRFVGTFGSTTTGTASLVLDLSALGIDISENVDGLFFQP